MATANVRRKETGGTLVMGEATLVPPPALEGTAEPITLVKLTRRDSADRPTKLRIVVRAEDIVALVDSERSGCTIFLRGLKDPLGVAERASVITEHLREIAEVIEVVA